LYLWFFLLNKSITGQFSAIKSSCNTGSGAEKARMVPSYFRRNSLKRLALFGLAAAARTSRLGEPGELSDAKTHRVVTRKIR
jgi:hypothetical protein